MGLGRLTIIGPGGGKNILGLGKVGRIMGTGGEGMNAKLDRGAAVGKCCPLNEGGNPNPGGAMWGISGKGNRDVLVTVKRSILMWVPCGGAPLGISSLPLFSDLFL